MVLGGLLLAGDVLATILHLRCLSCAGEVASPAGSESKESQIGQEGEQEVRGCDECWLFVVLDIEFGWSLSR